MKKLLSLIFIALSFNASAGWSVPIQIINDTIKINTHWHTCPYYLLKGDVRVMSGVTLTIDSGTIILGDKTTKGSLIIERGAKLYANGTEYAPILFTSYQDVGNRAFGDWGGIVICGNAPISSSTGQAQEPWTDSWYGGNNANDTSGRLSYVRIEFSGAAAGPNLEKPALALCGVGTGMQIDHIQVSYAGGDAFKWLGGTVNAKYLVSYAAWDDDFETDLGYKGLNQFLVAQREPNSASQNGSVSIESASTNDNIITNPVFSNATIIGPVGSNPANLAYSTDFVSGIRLYKGSGTSVLNSLIIGYPIGILISEPTASYHSTVSNIGTGTLQFQNNAITGISTSAPPRKDILFLRDSVFASPAKYDTTATGTNWSTLTSYTGPWSWMQATSFANTIYNTEGNGTKLWNPWNMTNPNFAPTVTSPICYNKKNLPAYVNTYYGGIDTFHNGKLYPFNPTKPINTDTSNFFKNYNAPELIPDFTISKANNSFFDKVNYIGAFAGTQTTSDNKWMKVWTNFDPVNADYDWPCGIYVSQLKNNIAANLYPNPAIKNTNLNIALEQKEMVTISLIDMDGKELKHIFKGEKQRGNYNYSISLDEIPAGLYTILVKTDSARKSIRLSVTK